MSQELPFQEWTSNAPAMECGTVRSNGSLELTSKNNNSESSKLLDISSDSESEPEPLQLVPPKRKVRFRKRLRQGLRPKTILPMSGQSDWCCCFSCLHLVKALALLMVAIILMVQIWFVLNVRSRVDNLYTFYKNNALVHRRAAKLDLRGRPNGSTARVPSKKMKKRKELDALVSSRASALSARVPAAASATASSHSVQELLKGNNRDSDSSDVESSYAVLASYRSGGVGTHGCSLGWAWLPLCLILLVGAAGALVWLHLGLRQDFDSLRSHLHRVDAENKHLPEALHEMHSRLQQLAQNLSNTAVELQKTSAQLASLSKEVADLKATTSSLQESVASAPQIKGLPNAVTDLKQNVANIGSQVSSLEQGVEALKEQHTTVQTMQKDLDHLKELVQRVTNSTSPEDQGSTHSLDDLKQSVLKSAAETKQALEQRLATLEADVRGLNGTAESLQHQQEQFRKLDNCSRNCSDLSPETLRHALDQLADETTHSAAGSWGDSLGQVQHLAALYKELGARLHMNESASNEADEVIRRAAQFVNETVQDTLTWHASSQARPWTTSSHEVTTDKSDAAGRPSATFEQGTVPPSTEDQSQLLQYVNDALQRVQQDMVAVSKLGSTPQAVAYVPTPVGKCPPPRKPVVPEQKRYIPAQSVPEYRPTPLSELRRRRASVLGATQRGSPPLAKKRREEGPEAPSAATPTTIPPVPAVKSLAPTIKVETDGSCRPNGKSRADAVEDDDSGSQDAGPALVREEEDAIIKMKDKRNLQASKDNPSPLSKDTPLPPAADDTSRPSKDTKDNTPQSSKPTVLPPPPADNTSVASSDALPLPMDTAPPLEDPLLVKKKEPPELPASEPSALIESEPADGTKEDQGNKTHSPSKSGSKDSSRSRHSSSKDKSKHSSSKSSHHRSSHSSHHSSSSKGHSSTKGKSSDASKSSAEKAKKNEKSDSETSSKKTGSDKKENSADKHKDGKRHSGSSTKEKKSSSSSKSSSKHHKSNHKSSHHKSSSSSKSSRSSHRSSSRKDLSADEKKPKSRRSSDDKESSKSEVKSGGCNGDTKETDESVLLSVEEDVSKDNGHSVDSRFSLEWELDSDPEDEDTLEECLRIFNEVQAVGDQPVSVLQQQKKKAPTSCEPAVPTKQRVAHDPDLTRRQEAQRGLSAHVSAAQAMHNRFAQLQKRYQDQASNGHQPSAFVSSVLKSQEGSQKRIAHVPNAPLLAAARKNATVVTNTFTVASQPKGQRRVAHVPALVLSKRPTIPAEYGSRVPVVVRQRYLNLFVDECAKSSTTEEEAIEKALSEEKQTYDRSSNKTVYLNVAVNTLKRLRREAAQQGEPSSVGATTCVGEQSKADLRPPGANKVISHALVLQGALGARTSFSIEKNRYKKPSVELTASRLYSLLEPYHLTPEQLEEHNYPLPHPTEPGRACFKGTSDTRKYSKHGESVLHCSRCGATFSLTKEGTYVRAEECVHHWGRLWKKRIAGSLESRYSCCEGDSQSDGCCVAKGHVHEGYDPSTLTGFVRTLAKSPSRGGNPGVYALDCEMCYTTEGVELTRITVVGWDLKPVYETLVKPTNPILDFNTRFSGITEEDMDKVQTTIRDVQAVLLSLFSDQTVLLGHSLDSDLKALRLVHSCVVDTAVVFPHRRGLPYKRALRTLMAEHLNKIIQNGVDGHDSQEDAVACMELMLWKVKEDLKRSR
ncbi:unnamed protein product [Ixodes hexagonus]